MDFWHSLKVHCSGLKWGQRGSFLGLWLHQKPAWTRLGKGWPRQVHPLILHLQCLSLGSGHGRWNMNNVFPGPRKLCHTWGHREGWSWVRLQLWCCLAAPGASSPWRGSWWTQESPLDLGPTESQERPCHDITSPSWGAGDWSQISRRFVESSPEQCSKTVTSIEPWSPGPSATHSLSTLVLPMALMREDLWVLFYK